MTADKYIHPCGGDMCLNSPCCEDGLLDAAVTATKIDHSSAISELEWAIRNNLITAYRCMSYNDPQEEIDIYFERNKALQATVDFLKEHSDNTLP